MARPARLLAALGPDATGPSDADLLARFVADQDAGAFELLVYRHARLVLRTCRAVLRDHHAAEDAAQAVFLALARQVRAVRGETLAGWLFRVSRRVAVRAARRQPPAAADVDPDAIPVAGAGLGADPAEARLLHEELAHLPEAYRAPILLCYFEGLSRADAARRLGWPDGTVAGRLARGKERLAVRLARRGVVPALLVVTVEAVPPSFAGAVSRAAVAYSAGSTAGLPATVVRLVTQETRRTAMRKLTKVLGVALSLVVVAAGLGLGALGGQSAGQPPLAKGTEPLALAADLPDGAAVRLGSAALRHPDILTHLRFTADGRHLLTYGLGKLRRWDAKTGAAVPDPARDFTTTFGTTLLSPDATRVVAPHVDHSPNRMSVREYDLATDRHAELFPVPDRRPGGHYGAQKFVLSPDGGLLAEGWGNELYVWDLRTRAVRHHLKFSGTQTFPGPFTPDGKHLLTAGGDDGAVRFWDVATGKQTRVLTREGRAPSGVSRLAVSSDGRWLAAAANSFQLGVGAEVAVWDLTAGDPPRVVILPEGFAHALAFGPGDLYTVEQPSEREAMPATVVTRWEAATGRRVGRWAGPHPGGLMSLVAAVGPDGGTLAVGTGSGVVRLYDTRSGAELARPTALTTRVVGVAYGPAGEVRTVGADGAVFTWDAATGRRLGAREAPGVTAAVGPAKTVVSSDGRWALTYARKPAGQHPEWAADLRDAMTGETRQSWGLNGPVRVLVPVPGGPLLIGVVEVSGVVGALAWDTTTGRPVPGFGVSLDRARSRYAVSPDGSVFWVVDEERATGYDPATGRERFAWKLADQDVLGRPVPKAGPRPGLVWGVAASPDGKTLAVAVGGEMYTDAAKRTHNLVLVEAPTGKVLRRVPTAERPPTWLAFSPDGSRLAGAPGVWEVATLRQVRRFPAGPEVTGLAFSPDSKQVATGHANGTAVVWPVGAD